MCICAAVYFSSFLLFYTVATIFQSNLFWFLQNLINLWGVYIREHLLGSFAASHCLSRKWICWSSYWQPLKRPEKLIYVVEGWKEVCVIVWVRRYGPQHKSLLNVHLLGSKVWPCDLTNHLIKVVGVSSLFYVASCQLPFLIVEVFSLGLIKIKSIKE